MPQEQWKNVEVVQIDIVNDPFDKKDYKEEEDPAKFKSVKTGRGALQHNWKEHSEPMMCAYKLVTMEFKWWGLQSRVESFTMKVCFHTTIYIHSLYLLYLLYFRFIYLCQYILTNSFFSFSLLFYFFLSFLFFSI